MVQELISSKRVAIVGAGPSGCICAKFLTDSGFDVSLFDKGKFLRTILPTGGGKCNLAHHEFDFKKLASNYPRGEKFLYSIFSRFSTSDTLQFFKSIGVETYCREDNRIFPVSNSSHDVREKLLKSLKCEFIQEEVKKIEYAGNFYKLTSDKSSYAFDYVVISIGGHAVFDLVENLGIKIIEPVQALVGLISEDNLSELAGVSLKNTILKVDNKKYNGDILFTHKGISGPLIYKISSIYARKNFPYQISLCFVSDIDLQDCLNKNSKKEIKNLLSDFVPKSLGVYILKSLNINPETLCHQIDGKNRNKILEQLTNFVININGKTPEGEVVTCGGVDLNEINSKTLESKKYNGLYFCGEVLDIDGFCGGFNLQNCWSTGYVVSESIKSVV